MRDRHLDDMVHHRDPVTMPPDATVQEACRKMRTHRIGCVLVTDAQDRLLGIFTGRDAVCRIGAECHDPARTRLSEVMTAHPQTLPPQASALDALRLMQDGGFRHVPLVRDGVAVGVVSRGDFRAMEHARLNEENGYWETLR
ncbi:CBS domain-containing protein [Falsiroseomonas oryziterrae]|uniref:CBS domain-containing protein n=1 Tax=Falsiroseomonas oryziterrae TaxID=2911368 RepID=UPI001F43F04C|nr:CBS domain-containing protein [Roseomonas sp. NPKOSM-4]